MRTVLDFWQNAGKRTRLVAPNQLARGSQAWIEKIAGCCRKDSAEQLAVKEALVVVRTGIVHLEVLETFAVETHWERAGLKRAGGWIVVARCRVKVE